MIYQSIVGPMEVIYEDNHIISARFINHKSESQINIDVNHTKYKLSGTPFQIKVWQEIALIPFGETKTYSDIAKAYRAVANVAKIKLF